MGFSIWLVQQTRPKIDYSPLLSLLCILLYSLCPQKEVIFIDGISYNKLGINFSGRTKIEKINYFHGRMESCDKMELNCNNHLYILLWICKIQSSTQIHVYPHTIYGVFEIHTTIILHLTGHNLFGNGTKY